MQNLSCSSCSLGKEPNSLLAAPHLQAVAHQLLIIILGLHSVFNKPDRGAHRINCQAG